MLHLSDGHNTTQFLDYNGEDIHKALRRGRGGDDARCEEFMPLMKEP